MLGESRQISQNRWTCGVSAETGNLLRLGTSDCGGCCSLGAWIWSGHWVLSLGLCDSLVLLGRGTLDCGGCCSLSVWISLILSGSSGSDFVVGPDSGYFCSDLLTDSGGSNLVVGPGSGYFCSGSLSGSGGADLVVGPDFGYFCSDSLSGSGGSDLVMGPGSVYFWFRWFRPYCGTWFRLWSGA